MKRGETVEVRFQKIINPVDSNAITFMYKTDGLWERICYIVSEALTENNQSLY